MEYLNSRRANVRARTSANTRRSRLHIVYVWFREKIAIQRSYAVQFQSPDTKSLSGVSLQLMPGSSRLSVERVSLSESNCYTSTQCTQNTDATHLTVAKYLSERRARVSLWEPVEVGHARLAGCCTKRTIYENRKTCENSIN